MGKGIIYYTKSTIPKCLVETWPKIDVVWSDFLVLVKILAAAF